MYNKNVFQSVRSKGHFLGPLHEDFTFIAFHFYCSYMCWIECISQGVLCDIIVGVHKSNLFPPTKCSLGRQTPVSITSIFSGYQVSKKMCQKITLSMMGLEWPPPMFMQDLQQKNKPSATALQDAGTSARLQRNLSKYLSDVSSYSMGMSRRPVANLKEMILFNLYKHLTVLVAGSKIYIKWLGEFFSPPPLSIFSQKIALFGPINPLP